MKSLLFLLICLNIFVSCERRVSLNERHLLEQKIDAFKFLSDYHHQLHIMIGEEAGNKIKAFDEFKSAPTLKSNNELLPVYNALKRIDNVLIDTLNVKKLDDLVDYYQSGLSMQIEAILRAYGHKGLLDIDNTFSLYNNLSKD